MKVAQLSTSDLGGAGIAAKNLHGALRAAGVDSTFITKLKMGPGVEAHQVIQEAPLSLLQRAGAKVQRLLTSAQTPEQYYLQGRAAGLEHFSFPWSELEPYSLPAMNAADIVHLHWVSDGFIDYKKIFKEDKKFVWTLHDMNPFTGGCHHSDGSMKFETNCNYCFQLQGTRDEYLSGKILRYKLEALEKIGSGQLVIVAPSQWLASLSQRSRLFGRFEHKVIRNVVSLPEQAVSREDARKRYGISANETVFLFVAHHFDNPRKGIGTLVRAFEKLKDASCRIFTVGEKMTQFRAARVEQLGYVNDLQKIKDIYTIADAFVLPSLAENFPNTIAEALLCGTPVIASRVGGIPEQVTESNGLLVDAARSDAWLEALEEFAVNKQRYNRAEIAAKAKEDYDAASVVKETLALYGRLLQR